MPTGELIGTNAMNNLLLLSVVAIDAGNQPLCAAAVDSHSWGIGGHTGPFLVSIAADRNMDVTDCLILLVRIRNGEP